MNTPVKKRLVSFGAAALLASSPLVVQAPAEAAGLTCRASMSDATPKMYSSVYVRVKTAPKARVRTVAHYKTTNTAKSGRANTKGRANIKYYISGSTPGFRVKVDVTVTKNGKKRTCSTSFRSHR